VKAIDLNVRSRPQTAERNNKVIEEAALPQDSIPKPKMLHKPCFDFVAHSIEDESDPVEVGEILNSFDPNK